MFRKVKCKECANLNKDTRECDIRKICMSIGKSRRCELFKPSIMVKFSKPKVVRQEVVVDTKAPKKELKQKFPPEVEVVKPKKPFFKRLFKFGESK